MAVNPIIGQGFVPPETPTRGYVTGAAPLAETFGKALTEQVERTNALQAHADESAVQVAAGDLPDLHQATIAMEEAKLALEFTVQVRNKVVEAYQEIMRMQV